MATSANPGNYEVVASQTLRALRGKRSQKALAQRLGYRANPVTDWENGRRYPTAREFLEIAERLGHDVKTAFASFHQAPLVRGNGGFNVAAWLNALRGDTPTKRIAEQAGRSRFAVQRWMSGRAEPRLHEFLLLVDVVTGRVYDLVAALVPIELVPHLRERHAAAAMVRSTAYLAPWSEAILRVIETSRYRECPAHPIGFVAGVLNITEEEERAAIDLLARGGILRNKDGLYEIVDTDTVDTKGDVGRVTHLLQHWNAVAHARISHRGSDDFYAYNVFAISSGDIDAAKQILRRAFRELRALVVSTSENERVALVNLQFVALDRGPA